MNYPMTPPEDEESCTYMIASPNSSLFNYTVNDAMDTYNAPYLKFIEEPVDKFRFRYKSEMAGTHGSLTGVRSDKSRAATYPEVELVNFDQPAIVRCSIYQYNVNQDHMPHAHRLIKRNGRVEMDDPHDVEISPETGYTVKFANMGIIHTAKKYIVQELIRKKTQLKEEEVARNEGRIRSLTKNEMLEIKGLAEQESKSINLNVVCLRFDAFYKCNGILRPICCPLYSQGINNLKSAFTGELKIVRMSHCTSKCTGGQEIFFLVERVIKKNIRIRFFEVDNSDNEIWEADGKFNDSDVHHQYAIVFKTPAYRDLNILSPVDVCVELVRKSDGARSDPRQFTFTPIKNSNQKRFRSDDSSSEFSHKSEDLIPTTINCTENLSEEMKKALKNADSEEFLKIFGPLINEYEGRDVNQYDLGLPQNIFLTDSRKAVCNKNELQEAFDIYKQIRNMTKSAVTKDECINFLKHHLGTDGVNNPLHTFVTHGKVGSEVFFLLALLGTLKCYPLINVRNSSGKTLLMLAAQGNQNDIFQYLLNMNAHLSITDNDLNTVFHYIVKEGNVNMLKAVLLKKQVLEKGLLDQTNADGDSALILAIKRNNLEVVKLLCKAGSNVNEVHKTNGFTPLRFALENRSRFIVQVLLELPNLDATIKDFKGCSALQIGIGSDMPGEIIEDISAFMEKHSLVVEVKEEVEDDPSDESDGEDNVEIPMQCDIVKLEPKELEELYKDVKDFTPECLKKLSGILDEDDSKLGYLMDLLDLGHLVRAGIISKEPSLTKNLLEYSTRDNSDSVLTIRNFFENLDEFEAVAIIDAMARSSKS